MRKKKAKKRPAKTLGRADKIKAIQRILFPGSRNEWDGIWGRRSQGALDTLLRPDEQIHKAMASSFADPEDVRKYKQCRAAGYSVAYCLKHAGDNGVGRWGDDTTGATPMCALNTRHIIEKWGSIDAGKHKRIDVEIDGKEVSCILADTGAPYDRIDLNPGAVAAFGLKPPILVPAKWRWA